jgi:CBS domain-containing protein
MQPLREAIELMAENDYSQLPVVEAGKALGLVTTTSALNAMCQLGVQPESLYVTNAIKRSFAKVRPDDELIDLIVRLKTDSAVLVVDHRERLSGILTSFDAMEFFRVWAEERMLVEDIEAALRECVLLPFKGEDDPALADAIKRVKSRADSEARPLRKALAAFLTARGEPVSMSDEQVRAAFEAGFLGDKPPVFTDLDLSDFIQLFLAKERWSFYAPVVAPDASTIRSLLDEVRKTRNALAHLRGEITAEERNRLKYCNDLLIVSLRLLRARVAPASSTAADQVDEIDNLAAAPVEEEDDNSRYAPLGARLQNLSLDQNELSLSFEAVEKILGTQLPASARVHGAWWANDTTSHPQSQAWLSAGWKVESVDFEAEKVRYARIRERSESYRAFFSELVSRLRKSNPALGQLQPSARHWIDLVRLPAGKAVGHVIFAFTRRRSARVEFHIDCGDRAKNKQLFERLRADAEAITAECGEPNLAWERLEDARASRIAAYRPIFITEKEKLPTLLSWAEQAIPRFVETFSRRLGSIEPPGRC